MDSKRQITAVTLYLLIFLVSLYTLSISTAPTTRNQGEGFMKIGELETFLITGTIGWDGSSKWGATGRDGKKYNWHQFGQQLLVLPLYLFMRGDAYAYYFVNIAATALTAVLIMRILLLLGFNLRASALTALIYGSATLAWYYGAKTPHEHAPDVVFIMAAIYYGMRYRTGLGAKNLYKCMIAVGLGFIVRYDAILSVLPLSLYFFTGREDKADEKFSLLKTAVVAAFLLAPFFLINAYYSYYRFGDVFQSGHRLGTYIPEKAFGIEFIPQGLIGAFLSPGRSIFLFSPVLLLFPFYIRGLKRRVDSGSFTLFVSAAVVYTLFYCYFIGWYGDWCFGPRLFLPIVPFMVLPLAAMFEGWIKMRFIKKSLITAVILLSVITQIVFISSNTWLSNAMRYGIDDDSRIEIGQKYRRSFGDQGTWTALASFFPIKYSQFFNQLKVFKYTLLMTVDESNAYEVAREIRESESPYIVLYLNLLKDFDLWWLQRGVRLDKSIAAAMAAVGLFALIQTVRHSRRRA